MAKERENSIGWKFPVEIDATTGKIKTTDIERDIKEAIFILLSTKKGERIARPDYGCELYEFIFENITYSLITNIQDEVQSCIKKFEKRVEDVEVEVEYGKDESKLEVHIFYRIKDTSTEDSLVYVLDLLN